MAVSLTFTGNTSDAEAAIARLERKYADLENRLGQLKTKGQKSDTDEWDKSLASVVTKYGLIGAGIGAASLAMRSVFDANEKWIGQLDEIVAKTNEATVKLQIQTGMQSADVKKMLPLMEKSLMNVPVASMNEGIRIQTQLGSSGFNAKDVQSGAAFDAMLKLKAATNSFGEGQGDPKELALALSMFLKGGGDNAPSAASILRAGGSVTSLFETSDLQISDLKQLAPKMALLKNFGLSNEESLGAFAALTDVMGGNKADTGLAQFVSRTSTIGAYKERAETLPELGLKPEDLAMAPGGKGFMETVDKLRGGLSKVPVERRNEILAKIYGEEAGPTAALLTGDLNDKTKDYIKKANDQQIMNRNVQTFQESAFAADQRSLISKDFANARFNEKTGGYTWKQQELAHEARIAKEREAAAGPMDRFKVTATGVMEDVTGWASKNLGMMPSEIGETREAPGQNNITNAIRNYLQNGAFGMAGQSGGGQKEMIDALNANTDAVKENNKRLGGGQPRAGRPINRNGNVE